MKALIKSLFIASIASTLLAAEPIRIGKKHQLFLDDHLIEHTEHLTRRVMQARKHETNPMIVPQAKWEPEGYFLPSVLFDEDERLFKAWIDGGGPGVFYFTSKDGINWERPKLHLFPEFDAEPTNRVILSGFEFDQKEAPPEKLAYLRSRERGWKYFCYASGVIKDKRETDPQRRYKMAYLLIDRKFQRTPTSKPGKLTALGVAFSPDGIHWTPHNEPASYATLDAPIHVNWDEKRQRWIMLGRAFGVVTEAKKAAQAAEPNLQYNMGRAVIRCESTDLIHWTPEKGDLVMASDAQDSPTTEIYDMRCVPYAGLHIGLVHMFLNNPDSVTLPIQIAVSRDNQTWQRLSDRSPFLAQGGFGEWDRSVISPPTADPLVVGDELWFYYAGRNCLHSTRWIPEDNPKLLAGLSPFRGSLGLAIIQRDRFVAMEGNYLPGILRTKPFIHDGGTLHVNAAMKFGRLTISLLDESGVSIQKVTIYERDATDIVIPELSKFSARQGLPVRLELQDAAGKPILGLGLEDCEPIWGDHVSRIVKWKTSDDVSAHIGKPVRLRFEMSDADLFSIRILEKDNTQ